MPVDPVEVRGPDDRRRVPCPHCGALWEVALIHQREGDLGVCVHCLGLLVFMENGMPRAPTYDEAEAGDQEPSVRAIRALYAKDDPGPEGIP